MNNSSKIIIVIVAIVILIVIYKYLFAAKTTVLDVTSMSLPNMVNSDPKSIICDKLSSEKIKSDALYKTAQDAFTSYNDALAGNVIQSALDSLLDQFKSAEYYYKNQVLNYNGLISANNCTNVYTIENLPFEYKGKSYTEVGVTVAPTGCIFTRSKQDVIALEQFVNIDYNNYLSASLYQKAPAYYQYKSTYDNYEAAVNTYNAETLKCYEDKGIAASYISKIPLNNM